MTDEKTLEALLNDGESVRVERKSSPTDGERIRQAICAYANDLPDSKQPGYVFVGVDDQGEPTGLKIDDQLLQKLSFMRDDGKILPLPSMSVDKRILKGKPVAVIEVQPSVALPVRFNKQVYIRIGSRRAIATIDEERRLTERNIAGTLPFDHRPCLSATLDDLNVESFRESYLPKVIDATVIRENNRTIQYQLASLRLFDLRRGVPTNAGILAFGHDPLGFFPGAYIQFTRYDGMTRADRVADSKQIRGGLRHQLEQLDALLPIQITNTLSPGSGLKFDQRPDYPIGTIREFVLNAIMHRTYENTNAPILLYWFHDRVEILSPGGLYGQVTPQNYESVNDYRNPGIAEVLKGLGYVERFGSGIARAQALLLENGNPRAIFDPQSTHVFVTMTARDRPIDAAARDVPQPPDTPAMSEPDRPEEPPRRADDDDERT